MAFQCGALYSLWLYTVCGYIREATATEVGIPVRGVVVLRLLANMIVQICLDGLFLVPRGGEIERKAAARSIPRGFGIEMDRPSNTRHVRARSWEDGCKFRF